jgi:tRNA threonylcarbamoyladenosine biosynthesis protein TsaB
VITLALDTSTRAGSVAVRRDGVTVHAQVGNVDRPHATRLPSDLVAALREVGAHLDDVTLLAACLGPGAFTGLRVGIATIQGIAFAGGLPTVGVSALDALAFAALNGEREEVAVWLDGARGEVFAARYRRDPGATFGVVALGEPTAAKPEAVLDAWEHDEWQTPHLWIGEGAVLHRDVIARRAPDAEIAVTDVPRAALVAELGERAFARGLAGPPHALRPVYVRRSDAELARERAAAALGHS